MSMENAASWLECIRCRARYGLDEVRYACECGALLAVERAASGPAVGPALFDDRARSAAPVDRSGVWRFRERVLEAEPSLIVTHPEGGTRLYAREALSRWAGVQRVQFKHEGENPTGSFKDRGMTVALTQAVRLKARAVACASTGNTSSSLAAYAGQAGLGAVVFVPAGKISAGKLAQTLAYGALTLQVRGDFDAAMELVMKASRALGIYLVNSVNPFRIEGQKTIVWELLQDLGWDPPDWVAFPAGNLGNTSAFGKALREAQAAGWIKKVPRLLAVQAAGANPFYQSYAGRWATRHKVRAETVASAIRIGDPVSYERARAAIEQTNGVVTQVTDEELLAAKREIDRAGIGCEPASACSLAGVKKLRGAGAIRVDESVVCVLTGHVLKDPDVILKSVPMDGPQAQVVEVDPSLAAVEKVLSERLGS